MKIIDAHIHFSNIQSFKDTANNISFVDYTKKGLIEELKNSNVVCCVSMGVTETKQNEFPDYNADNPMINNLDSLPENLYTCLGINPSILEKNNSEIEKIENYILNQNNIVGLKIYAGYYPYYVYDKVYEPIYSIAEKYSLPIVIHTGDTYSQRGYLKYSHPLTVDELAVNYSSINFIIAHLGDPWVMDTAEIILKNSNVYADLSGFLVGNSNYIKSYGKNKLFINHFKKPIYYADSYSSLIFGSDWPLVPIKPYIKFIKNLIPQKHHYKVFYENALKVFKRINLN